MGQYDFGVPHWSGRLFLGCVVGASGKDRKIFFNALVNLPALNDKLKQGMVKHNKFKLKK
jgi:hypothetical protein